MFIGNDMKTRRHNVLTLFCSAFVVGLVGLIALGVLTNDAHALRITMKRVIFEGPKRTEVLTIINNTAEEQIYRLGWRRMRMTEDSSLQALDDNETAPDLKTADNMIRFAPRRVVLPPGRTQQVRLMLRRPKDLADGEYRSHFWIQPEEKARAFDPNGSSVKASGQAVQITMLTGLTLPVFVRAGKMEASGRITDARLITKKDRPAVTYTLHREGNRSLYGDIEITCRVGGEEIVAAAVRGIAIYEEISKRQVTNVLGAMPANGCSDMKIKYTATEDDPLFKGGTIAEASVASN
jgi:P pilus assembly chaperone PapD